MPNLAPGTVLHKRECAGCKVASVSVKLNKNGMAYYFCNECSHHQKWGRAHSQEMQTAYLKTRAANVNAAPKPKLLVEREKDEGGHARKADGGNGYDWLTGQ